MAVLTFSDQQAEIVGHFTPLQVAAIELAQPLPALPIRRAADDVYQSPTYHAAYVLVQLHAHTLGTVEIPLAGGVVAPDQVADILWEALGECINAHLATDGLPALAGLDAEGVVGPALPFCLAQRAAILAARPFVSVIISTHERGGLLRACLGDLLQQSYEHFEVIVVDNAPTTAQTALIAREYAADPRINYAAEARQGAAWGRNQGLALARGEIAAFLDDDVRVDPHWLAEVVSVFLSAPEVNCVTNLIMPVELETLPQWLVEKMGGYGKGFAVRRFDRRTHRPTSPLFPFAAGQYGSGAAMAFRREPLLALGGFDPSLPHAEDIGAFFRIIMAGGTLVYTPHAVTYHLHPRSYLDLRRQRLGYGIGLAAFLTMCLVDQPGNLVGMLRRMPQGIRHFRQKDIPQNQPMLLPFAQDLKHIEQHGLRQGPAHFWRARRTLRAQGGANIHPSVSSRWHMVRHNLLGTWHEHQAMLTNAASLVGTGTITSLLGFVYWWAAARFFTPTAVGFASATVGVMMLLGSLSLLGLGTLMVGRLQQHRQQALGLASAALFIVSSCGALLGLAFALIAPMVKPEYAPLRQQVASVGLFTVGVAGTTAGLMLDQVLVGMMRGIFQFARNALFTSVKLALLVGLGLALTHQSGMMVFATWVAGVAVSLIPGFVYMLKAQRSLRAQPAAQPRPAFAVLLGYWREALQHHGLNLTLQLPLLLLPVLVTILLSTTANAWFYIAFMIANIMFISANSLTTVLFAVNSADHSALAHRARVTLGLALAITVAGNIGIALFAPDILAFFGSSYRQNAEVCLRILALAAFPEIVRSHFIAISRVRGRMGVIILPLLAGCVLEVLGATLGGVVGGLQGLCLGWTLVLTLEALCMSRTVVQVFAEQHSSALVEHAVGHE